MDCPAIGDDTRIPVGLSLHRMEEAFRLYWRPCRLEHWIALFWWDGALWVEWA